MVINIMNRATVHFYLLAGKILSGSYNLPVQFTIHLKVYSVETKKQ